jgi:hypothetical protein
MANPPGTAKISLAGAYAKDLLGHYQVWCKKFAEAGADPAKTFGVFKEVFFRLALSGGDITKVMDVQRPELELLDNEFRTMMNLAGDIGDDPDDELYG